eukprot:COSAG06_NODE_40962_length_396_cov_1.397306_1_plen_21_part_10
MSLASGDWSSATVPAGASAAN